MIGPHRLGLIGSGNTTLPDLGQLGLLYLMFVAGVELDLNLLRRNRRSTVIFGLLTFVFPMTLGAAAGLALGWSSAVRDSYWLAARLAHPDRLSGRPRRGPRRRIRRWRRRWARP